jgi:hypothetical protein
LTGVIKQEISKGYAFNILDDGRGDKLMHYDVALRDSAWIREMDSSERQLHGAGLLLKHFPSSGVHGYADISLVHDSEQVYDLVLWVLQDAVKRPCAVLGATPVHECPFF